MASSARRRILLATTNPGKIREIRGVLADAPVDLVTLADLPAIPEPDENGTTFADNARLKALYYEARLAMKPSTTGDDIARWFWGETAAGQVLRRVRDRLDASEDPRWKAAAFGVAR